MERGAGEVIVTYLASSETSSFGIDISATSFESSSSSWERLEVWMVATKGNSEVPGNV